MMRLRCWLDAWWAAIADALESVGVLPDDDQRH